MSLLSETTDIQTWEHAVQTCQPEDIADIADQLALVQPPELRAEIAEYLGPVVVARGLSEQLTDHWIYSTARYAADVPGAETIESPEALETTEKKSWTTPPMYLRK